MLLCYASYFQVNQLKSVPKPAISRTAINALFPKLRPRKDLFTADIISRNKKSYNSLASEFLFLTAADFFCGSLKFQAMK